MAAPNGVLLSCEFRIRDLDLERCVCAWYVRVRVSGVGCVRRRYGNGIFGTDIKKRLKLNGNEPRIIAYSVKLKKNPLSLPVRWCLLKQFLHSP